MTNKAIILNMYKEIFDQHDFSRIADFMHQNYIQHNPRVASGLKGFVDFFQKHFKRFPDFKIQIKHIIEEGDLVAVHTHAIGVHGEAGAAVVDIYRFEDGKVAEHWDVIQPVPDEFVHSNGMF